MKTKGTIHTPTLDVYLPYKAIDNGAGIFYLVDAKGRRIASFESLLDGKDNGSRLAEMYHLRNVIVRAVNSREALLEAAKNALQIFDCDPWRNGTNGEQGAIARLKQAIAKDEKGL